MYINDLEINSGVRLVRNSFPQPEYATLVSRYTPQIPDLSGVKVDVENEFFCINIGARSAVVNSKRIVTELIFLRGGKILWFRESKPDQIFDFDKLSLAIKCVKTYLDRSVAGLNK